MTQTTQGCTIQDATGVTRRLCDPFSYLKLFRIIKINNVHFQHEWFIFVDKDVHWENKKCDRNCLENILFEFWVFEKSLIRLEIKISTATDLNMIIFIFFTALESYRIIQKV